jgi:hypothetical protein
MKNALAYLLARAQEPSTYAGLAALAAAFGVHVDNSLLQAGVQAAVAIAGLGAIVMKEHAP